MFHRLTGDVDPRDFVRVSPNCRVLDFGCGDAGYLSELHALGVNVSGVEIADHLVASARSRGLDVHKVNSLERVPFPDREFDIVYLIQVFEHLPDPEGTLVELARVLKPGGELYLAVPNAKSIWRSVFGKNWVSGWFAPFHLVQYDRDGLTRLGLRNGFTFVESWSSTPESWFRLNLKAVLYAGETHLDRRRSWIDGAPVRFSLMAILRIAEIPSFERDCLVVKLKKRSE